jgi:hypothetical protein
MQTSKLCIIEIIHLIDTAGATDADAEFAINKSRGSADSQCLQKTFARATDAFGRDPYGTRG